MDQVLVKSRRRIPGWLLPGLGYTLSALSLIWVFHGFNFQQTLADLDTNVNARLALDLLLLRLPRASLS